MTLKYNKYSVRKGVQKVKTRTALAISAVMLAFSGGTGLTLFAFSAVHAEEASTVVVRPSDTQGWSVAPLDPGKTPGSITYSSDYGAPSGFGSSSLKISTVTGTDKAQYAHAVDGGSVSLSEVGAIGYSTFRPEGSTANPNQLPAINLVIDFNGAAAGGFATLVYEPVYQSGGVAAIHNGEWQTWDANGDAIWWSTKVMPGVPNAFTSYVSLNDIMAANPDAVVQGYIINQGTGNPNLTAGVDAFTFGDVTYNFEDTPVAPTDKDACKDGGWMNFQTSFKNQGQCVAFVNHNDGVGQDDTHARKH
jgi:hypothetical protein